MLRKLLQDKILSDTQWHFTAHEWHHEIHPEMK